MYSSNNYMQQIIMKVMDTKPKKSKADSVKEADATDKEEQDQKFSATSFQSLISNILEANTDKDKLNNDPQTIRIKNNLLLIILILSAYGVYYLIGDFLHVLLLSYIAGIAYNQSKLRFIGFFTKETTKNEHSESWLKRIIKIVGWLVFGFVFPRIRYLLTNPHKYRNFPTFTDFVSSIKKSDRYIILVCEVLIGLRVIYLILGTVFQKIGKKLRPTNIQLLQKLFAVLTIIIVIAFIILIPTVLFKQITNIGLLLQKKVQQKLGCEIYSLKNSDNDNLPLCSQKIAYQNSFIQETVTQFQVQNQTLEDCLGFWDKINQQYLDAYIEEYQLLRGNVYRYQEIGCTWYSFLEKAVSYGGFTLSVDKDSLQKLFSTGTNIFKLMLGNLAWILSSLSTSIFNLTTFITTFLLTIKSKSQSSAIKLLLSLNKQQLITSITNLIQATLFIVLQHFFMSYLLLEVLEVTPFNLICSIGLASMALFPFFRPWIGVLLLTAIRVFVLRDYYFSLAFLALYYYLSEKIYSNHYRKMQLHEIVTNMSVLFGIYQFGLVGVFYGPLIIIIYQCVQNQIFRKSS